MAPDDTTVGRTPTYWGSKAKNRVMRRSGPQACRVRINRIKFSGMPLTIQLHPSQRQTAFNLERWRELLADRDLARLPHRIETDRHGHILMSPPPAPSHGVKQARIATLFDQLLPNGIVITECPVSTSDGVKAIDVAWLAPERRQEVDSAICFAQAPEICVEILSPSNTAEEISEKIALYFEAGAQEVWTCDQSGTVEFYHSGIPQARQSSEMCPEFPPRIDA
jgi:Uma2 family endonuclease